MVQICLLQKLCELNCTIRDQANRLAKCQSESFFLIFCKSLVNEMMYNRENKVPDE